MSSAVSVEDNFFDDLGAHSLLMARFCARVRKPQAWANVSMRDIYLNPTVARLAAHLEHRPIETVDATQAGAVPRPVELRLLDLRRAAACVLRAPTAVSALWVLDTGLDWTYAALDERAAALRPRAWRSPAGVVLRA